MATLPLVLILGPTAGGKTDVALELAELLETPGAPPGGECVCADSMQVYRGMDLGTAKPTPAQQRRVPHHLLDVADPAVDGFTVDTWIGRAEQAIRQIHQRRRVPIIVGGTNLYIQALLGGLTDSPEPDLALRTRLEAMDGRTLRAWLERVDPVAAERIHPNDRKRTIRAIEIHECSGTPMSQALARWEHPSERPGTWIIGLDYPVDAINRRINARVRRMFEAGLVEEVRSLVRRGLGRQAREALGYKQVLCHLEGRASLEETIEQVKIGTRRLAKQQRTWLRRFRRIRASAWLEAEGRSPQDLARQALASIESGGGFPPPTAWPPGEGQSEPGIMS